MTRDVRRLPKSKLATNAPSPKSLGRPAPHNSLSFQTLGKHVSHVLPGSFGPPLPEASRGLGPPGTKVASPCPTEPLTTGWSLQALAHVVTEIVSERGPAWKGGCSLDPSIDTFCF